LEFAYAPLRLSVKIAIVQSEDSSTFPGVAIMSIHSLMRVGCLCAGSSVFVARVEGRGTLRESPAFHTFVSELFRSYPAAVLTLDLEDCEYLDSTFLGCLISLGKLYARGPARRFVIAATPATRSRLLVTTHVDRVLPLINILPAEAPEWSTIPIEPIEAHELGCHVMECHEHLAEVGGPQATAFRSIVEHLAHDLGQFRS
jgi:anti-anti-sigma regulatory factor